MGVIPTKLSQRIRFLRSKIFFSGLGIRVMTLNSFKAMLCFHNYKHKWGNTIACFYRKQVNCLWFQTGGLVSFLYSLCTLFYSHLDFTYLLDLLSDLLIFSAWLLNYSSVQVIGNSAHLFFYPVLTHTVMVWCISISCFDLSIAKLFYILLIVVTYLLQIFQIVQKVADSWP